MANAHNSNAPLGRASAASTLGSLGINRDVAGRFAETTRPKANMGAFGTQLLAERPTACRLCANCQALRDRGFAIHDEFGDGHQQDLECLGGGCTVSMQDCGCPDCR